MKQSDTQFSTGLVGLDGILDGLTPGDNIVWQVDSVEDYVPFVEPCWREALRRGQRVIYFRFAEHPALVDSNCGVEVYHLRPEAGFEQFISEIHRVIEDVGSGGYYLFDCLSDLAADWNSDRMLGNFFMLTCPYLQKRRALSYFAVFRNRHSFHTTTPITDTTRILIDVYRQNDKLYVHPLKVQQRHSPTMYMLHAWEGEEFIPVIQSVTITEILAAVPWSRLDSASYRLGFWGSTFARAEELQGVLDRGEKPDEDVGDFVHQLLRMAISRGGRMLDLASEYLTLSDIIEIRKRMIGTGQVGGKTVGMLLARAILRKTDSRWDEVLEPHDSFFIGADVFYTYLVQNGLWWMKQKQKDRQSYLVGAKQIREKMLGGTFPEYIIKQFSDMLDYFGQSPIIVRSSSLLEDSFGNAFAGKYESVFCANQGSRDKRLENFLSAVRTIYASTMSEKALTYRAQRGMLDRDEQMALLVQRVSGAVYDKYFYPQLAGVGLSFNPYVWSKNIDPTAGVLRLVFGLGTRAVDRHDDDYTRVVALNEPTRRPESNFDEAMKYSQKKVDFLDLEANQQMSKKFSEVTRKSCGPLLEMFVSRDENLARRAVQSGLKDANINVLTFDELLEDTQFVNDMREMLQVLQGAYDNPVDIEFPANFLSNDRYKINLLQCRPFQCKGGSDGPEIPRMIPKKDMVLEARGAVIGQSREVEVNRLVYVVPSVYAQLPISDKHEIARLIGRIMHVEEANSPKTTMLLGPGRWGTTSPSLGVPIHFSEINTVSVLFQILLLALRGAMMQPSEESSGCKLLLPCILNESLPHISFVE